MRIIAGRYASRQLETRKGRETRPTLDKVRQAVFSSLGGFFDGGIFLDLYAGSGANGLEAISRGADQAIFVDASYQAIQYIKKNVISLGCEKQSRIMPMKDAKALKILAEEGIQLDYVYLDPPFAKQTNDQVLSFLDEHQMMNEGGRVIIESAEADHFDKEYTCLHPYKTVVYGSTRITYYEFRKPEE